MSARHMLAKCIIHIVKCTSHVVVRCFHSKVAPVSRCFVSAASQSLSGGNYTNITSNAVVSSNWYGVNMSNVSLTVYSLPLTSNSVWNSLFFRSYNVTRSRALHSNIESLTCVISVLLVLPISPPLILFIGPGYTPRWQHILAQQSPRPTITSPTFTPDDITALAQQLPHQI